MNKDFYIQFRHSAGNLHISLADELNGMCAWELIKTIKREYAGSGRIFVNTGGLGRITSAGADLFKLHMSVKHLRRDWLYFKIWHNFLLTLR